MVQASQRGLVCWVALAIKISCLIGWTFEEGIDVVVFPALAVMVKGRMHWQCLSSVKFELLSIEYGRYHLFLFSHCVFGLCVG